MTKINVFAVVAQGSPKFFTSAEEATTWADFLVSAGHEVQVSDLTQVQVAPYKALSEPETAEISVTARIDEYVATLNASAPKGDRYNFFRVAPRGRGIYTRIESGQGIHAFIDREGNVLKPATYKAPAKHVRFSLTDSASFTALLEAASQKQAFAGGYLYIR